MNIYISSSNVDTLTFRVYPDMLCDNRVRFYCETMDTVEAARELARARCEESGWDRTILLRRFGKHYPGCDGENEDFYDYSYSYYNY